MKVWAKGVSQAHYPEPFREVGAWRSHSGMSQPSPKCGSKPTTSLLAKNLGFPTPKPCCPRHLPAFPVPQASPRLVNPPTMGDGQVWLRDCKKMVRKRLSGVMPRCPPQHTLLIRKERRESWNKDVLGDVPTTFISHTIRGTLFRFSIT